MWTHLLLLLLSPLPFQVCGNKVELAILCILRPFYKLKQMNAELEHHHQELLDIMHAHSLVSLTLGSQN